MAPNLPGPYDDVCKILNCILYMYIYNIYSYLSIWLTKMLLALIHQQRHLVLEHLCARQAQWILISKNIILGLIAIIECELMGYLTILSPNILKVYIHLRSKSTYLTETILMRYYRLIKKRQLLLQFIYHWYKS